MNWEREALKNIISRIIELDNEDQELFSKLSDIGIDLNLKSSIEKLLYEEILNGVGDSFENVLGYKSSGNEQRESYLDFFIDVVKVNFYDNYKRKMM